MYGIDSVSWYIRFWNSSKNATLKPICCNKPYRYIRYEPRRNCMVLDWGSKIGRNKWFAVITNFDCILRFISKSHELDEKNVSLRFCRNLQINYESFRYITKIKRICPITDETTFEKQDDNINNPNPCSFFHIFAGPLENEIPVNSWQKDKGFKICIFAASGNRFTLKAKFKLIHLSR